MLSNASCVGRGSILTENPSDGLSTPTTSEDPPNQGMMHPTAAGIRTSNGLEASHLRVVDRIRRPRAHHPGQGGSRRLHLWMRRRLLVQEARAEPVPLGVPALSQEPGDRRVEAEPGPLALGGSLPDLQNRKPASASISKLLQILDPKHHLDFEHQTPGRLGCEVVVELPSLTAQCQVWDDLRGQEREWPPGGLGFCVVQGLGDAQTTCSDLRRKRWVERLLSV